MLKDNLIKYEDRICQIKELAIKNNNKISSMMLLDILNDKIIYDSDDTDRIIDLLEKEGIIVEENEEYDTGINIEPNTFIPAKVNITPRNMNINTILDRLKYKEIELNTDFQRSGNLWSVVKQSRLIESLMLKIPLPTFYFDASNENKWIVIDGLQRLSAFDNFMNCNTMKLSGLEYLTELNGYTFNELPRQYYRRIMETQIMVYTVEKGTPDDIIFNIFKRINTGGLVLDPQEIRHALYQGKGTDLIKELAKSDAFLSATGNGVKSLRMLDCEYVTRFIAFTELDYSTDYKGSIDNYLIMAMKKMNRSAEEELERIKHNFIKIMKICHLIFGKYAFRRINEVGRRGPINKAIFELWSVCFNDMSDNQINSLIEKKEEVLERLKMLLQDREYSTWIKSGDRYSMDNRIKRTKLMLMEVLDDK